MPPPAGAQPAAQAQQQAQPAAQPPAQAQQAQPTTPAGLPAAAAPAVSPTVQPQAAGAAVSAFTAGLNMAAHTGGGGPERDQYVRRFVLTLDSAVVLLVGVYRNTSGQPLPGVTEPASLSQRERDRWTRCRDLHWDLQSYRPALRSAMGAGFESPAVQQAARDLDTALAAVVATEECDNVASMLAAPDRWPNWGAQYATAARRFYQAWYAQVREAHDRNRALVVALNAVLPADRRIPVPPGLPRTPPYAGAAP